MHKILKDMGYINFIREYKRKLETDKDIAENKLDVFRDFRERLNFYVCLDVHTPMTIRLGFGMKDMFKLDDDDLKYLYNKYYPKISEELELELSEVKEKFNV